MDDASIDVAALVHTLLAHGHLALNPAGWLVEHTNEGNNFHSFQLFKLREKQP